MFYKLKTIVFRFFLLLFFSFFFNLATTMEMFVSNWEICHVNVSCFKLGFFFLFSGIKPKPLACFFLFLLFGLHIKSSSWIITGIWILLLLLYLWLHAHRWVFMYERVKIYQVHYYFQQIISEKSFIGLYLRVCVRVSVCVDTHVDKGIWLKQIMKEMLSFLVSKIAILCAHSIHFECLGGY